MKTTIRVIFLDIGGVILSNGWDHLSRQKAAENFGFSYDEMEKRHQCFFNIFETGGFTLDEYLDRVVFYHSQNFTKQEFKAFMFAQSVELPLMLPWLRKWKKEIEIPVFSANNEARELNEYRRSGLFRSTGFLMVFFFLSSGFSQARSQIFQGCSQYSSGFALGNALSGRPPATGRCCKKTKYSGFSPSEF